MKPCANYQDYMIDKTKPTEVKSNMKGPIPPDMNMFDGPHSQEYNSNIVKKVLSACPHTETRWGSKSTTNGCWAYGMICVSCSHMVEHIHNEFTIEDFCD